MSSPAPTPPYRGRGPRSFTGPFVLIVVGILFLLGNLGFFRWYHIGRWFAHYWPVLLIVWGIVRLAEHYRAQRSGTAVRSMGAGGVALLFLVIMFGLFATQMTRVNWDAVRGHINIDDNDFSYWGQTYSYEDQLSQAIATNAKLQVVNERGAVNVSVADDEQVKVSAHKRIKAENQKDADQWNEKTKPQLTLSENVVSLNANTEGGGDHGVVTTDLDITVPKKVSLVINARRGNVSVLGRDGDVDITGNKGEIFVSDINGKVNLNVQESSAKLSHLASDVSVQGRVRDFSLDDVKGAVRLDGEFMDGVRLSKCAQGVNFKSSRTDISLARLDGNLDLESDDLRGTDMNGPVRLITRDKDIQLRGVNGDLRLQNENGPLEIHMSKLGNLQIDNRNAEVEVHVPEKAAFQLEARARNGDIETDFNSLKVSDSDDLATVNGLVGNGGPKLVISNEHGNIQIRRGSIVGESLPTPPRPPREPAPPGPPDLSDN